MLDAEYIDNPRLNEQRDGWAGYIKPNINAIHVIPVKHGYVKCAVDLPHSTIHRFIERGVIDENWTTTVGDGE